MRPDLAYAVHQFARFAAQVLEDNNGALELARSQKFKPCTKHINIKYWHFVENVLKQNIEIIPVDIADQLADISAKPLFKEDFEKLRYCIQGADWTRY